MTVPTLDQLGEAIRASFAIDTCSPDDLPEWSATNASRGHCAMSALTVHDHLGGQLLCAEVHRDGQRFGYHWWNRLDGTDVDFTRDQFAPDEIVGEPWLVERPPGDGHLYGAQHQMFRERVAERLANGG